MRSTPRILIAAVAALIASGLAACGDATRALSPDRAVPVEQQNQGKDLQLAVRGELRSYPEHVIAEFQTEFSPSISNGAAGLSYEWVFGDGKRVLGEKASHVFADTGKQEVVLRVTNAAGQVTQLTKTVQISAGIAQLGTVLTGLVPGGFHACAIDASGVLYCWGFNRDGELGDGSTTHASSPVQLAGGIVFSQVAAGPEHSCALTSSGSAYCWGRNDTGQLGDGTFINRSVPTPVLTALTFISIAAGLSHTCALTSGGLAYCWGANDLGQLGDGGIAVQQTTPAPVAGGLTFTMIRVGYNFTCGLETSTHARCWGSNASGQIGNGAGGATMSDRVTTPTPVSGNRPYTQLDAGGSHACGVSKKTLYCWGWNYFGQVGSNSTEICRVDQPCMRNPTQLPANSGFSQKNVTSVSTGSSHSCALLSTGDAYCWGFNAFGQLGNGTFTSTTTPVHTSGTALLKSIHAGGAFTCGVGLDNVGYCWGSNMYGKLGLGDNVHRPNPTPVPGLTF
jgi:alpha-tubulin suppressor-like RCC1 family protein